MNEVVAVLYVVLVHALHAVAENNRVYRLRNIQPAVGWVEMKEEAMQKTLQNKTSYKFESTN